MGDFAEMVELSGLVRVADGAGAVRFEVGVAEARIGADRQTASAAAIPEPAAASVFLLGGAVLWLARHWRPARRLTASR